MYINYPCKVGHIYIVVYCKHCLDNCFTQVDGIPEGTPLTCTYKTRLGGAFQYQNKECVINMGHLRPVLMSSLWLSIGGLSNG